MKKSDILYFIEETNFNNVRNVFNKHILEFEEYRRAISKKGSAIHFTIERDLDFVFSKSHLSQLGKLYINDVFSELELNFIVDIIISSFNSFENENVAENLELLTDPEVNGHLSKEKVKELIKDYGC